MAGNQVTLLDACAVVNLYASRRISDILREVEGMVAIADQVFRESQFVFRGGTGDDAREREPVDLQSLIADGSIAVWTTDDDAELLTFIDLTLELDEGEAMTAALAIHRGCTVVTDDRKALRILRERKVNCRGTLDVIKTWSDRRNVPNAELATVLEDVRLRGNYVPARTHALVDWWESVFRSG
jgi:predicted nucleic acid-binding protein